jgi:hypothetical protein
MLEPHDVEFASAIYRGHFDEGSRIAYSLGAEGYLEMCERLNAAGLARLFRRSELDPYNTDVIIERDPETSGYL